MIMKLEKLLRIGAATALVLFLGGLCLKAIASMNPPLKGLMVIGTVMVIGGMASTLTTVALAFGDHIAKEYLRVKKFSKHPE
jgi:hypothetical protein